LLLAEGCGAGGISSGTTLGGCAELLEPPQGCASNADCVDQNSCTDDICNLDGTCTNPFNDLLPGCAPTDPPTPAPTFSATSSPTEAPTTPAPTFPPTDPLPICVVGGKPDCGVGCDAPGCCSCKRKKCGKAGRIDVCNGWLV
jgi:hypothetical protein